MGRGFESLQAYHFNNLQEFTSQKTAMTNGPEIRGSPVRNCPGLKLSHLFSDTYWSSESSYLELGCIRGAYSVVCTSLVVYLVVRRGAFSNGREGYLPGRIQIFTSCMEKAKNRVTLVARPQSIDDYPLYRLTPSKQLVRPQSVRPPWLVQDAALAK